MTKSFYYTRNHSFTMAIRINWAWTNEFLTNACKFLSVKNKQKKREQTNKQTKTNKKKHFHYTCDYAQRLVNLTPSLHVGRGKRVRNLRLCTYHYFSNYCSSVDHIHLWCSNFMPSAHTDITVVVCVASIKAHIAKQ